MRLGIANEPPIIASYGFMLPHKGLSELVQAFAAVREKRSDAILFLVNALYPSLESRCGGARAARSDPAIGT